MQSEITREELQKAIDIIIKIRGYCDSKVVGQNHLKHSLMIALITNGHILLESVPGLAKTTAAKVLTDAINGSFSRVQCTPDLLPSDIIGTQIYNMATNSFDTNIGPVKDKDDKKDKKDKKDKTNATEQKVNEILKNQQDGTNERSHELNSDEMMRSYEYYDGKPW